MQPPAIDNLLGYLESRKLTTATTAASLFLLIAWADWQLPNISIDFLYILPVAIVSAAFGLFGTLIAASACGLLRAAFDPLHWGPAYIERLLVATVSYYLIGAFIAEINRRRHTALLQLDELTRQSRLRQQAEIQLQVAVETSPVAFLTLDRQSTIILANTAAARLFGTAETSLLGHSAESYVPLLCRALRQWDGQRTLRTNLECRAHRAGGEVFLAQIWFSTYNTESGPALAAIVWDATEDIRDREGASVDSMMAASRIAIGAVSHEIRNLVAAATATLDSIPTAHTNEHYRALGTLIHGLDKIASSGLRLATGTHGESAEIHEVLEELRIILATSLSDEGIELNFTLPPQPLHVQMDRHALLQVLINLARNSQRALTDAPTRAIRISTATDEDGLHLEFHDTGPGVRNVHDLFRPFLPGAAATGLGLYISRALLRTYGGNLYYQPEPSGACFVISLQLSATPPNLQS